MAKILLGDVWYDELAPTALYESDYERIFVRQAPTLFPGWLTAPFKCAVVGDDGETAKPDMALISHDYRQWWVVEVELSHHPFHGHVLPQVRRLASATYGEAEARFLCRQSPKLSKKKVSAM